ncbi:MAG: hypothetical protein L0G46_08380 [Kocuria sp.]|nr:hypothetical protein [Kocuria sp.]
MEYSEMSEDLKRKVDLYNQQVPDGLLGMFASSAVADDGFGVTLIVGGNVFSGYLTTERGWVEAIAKMPGNGSEALSAGMLKGMEGIEEKPALSDEEWNALDDVEQREFRLKWTPSFIHLADANQFGFGGPVMSEPTPMRFRLSEVQGWYFGKMEKGEG